MYKGKIVSTLVPAYNEEKLISSTIEGMPDFVDHIIVIDDKSKDQTAKIVETLAKKNKKIIFIKHETNTGLGGAIKSAVSKAKELKTDIGVVMAGDNQMDPKYLPILLDPICDDGFDFTKANRFYAREGFLTMPKHRIVGSIALAFMTRVASGYWSIIDPQNGYVAYGPRVINELDFTKITNGYALENDILINLNILGMKIKEVPVPAVYGEETSTMKLWKIIPSFTIFLFFGFFRRILNKYFLRGIHPIFLFLTFGIFFILFGLVFGLSAWLHTLKTGVPATTGTVMLAALPFLMGFEMTLWAFVLDIGQESK